MTFLTIGNIKNLRRFAIILANFNFIYFQDSMITKAKKLKLCDRAKLPEFNPNLISSTTGKK